MTVALGTLILGGAILYSAGMLSMLLAFDLGDRLKRDVAHNFTDHEQAPPRSSSPKR